MLYKLSRFVSLVDLAYGIIQKMRNCKLLIESKIKEAKHILVGLNSSYIDKQSAIEIIVLENSKKIAKESQQYAQRNKG